MAEAVHHPPAEKSKAKKGKGKHTVVYIVAGVIALIVVIVLYRRHVAAKAAASNTLTPNTAVVYQPALDSYNAAGAGPGWQNWMGLSGAGNSTDATGNGITGGTTGTTSSTSTGTGSGSGSGPAPTVPLGPDPSLLAADQSLFAPADAAIHALGTGIGDPGGGGFGSTPYPTGPTTGFVAGGGAPGGDYFTGVAGLDNAISSLIGAGLKAGTYWSPSTYASLSNVANNPSEFTSAQVASAQNSLATGAASTAPIPTIYAAAYPNGSAPPRIGAVV